MSEALGCLEVDDGARPQTTGHTQTGSRKPSRLQARQPPMTITANNYIAHVDSITINTSHETHFPNPYQGASGPYFNTTNQTRQSLAPTQSTSQHHLDRSKNPSAAPDYHSISLNGAISQARHR